MNILVTKKSYFSVNWFAVFGKVLVLRFFIKRFDVFYLFNFYFLRRLKIVLRLKVDF